MENAKDKKKGNLTFKKDQVIYKENDYSDGFYIIEDGQVAILKSSKDGRLCPVAVLGEKEFVGSEQLLGIKKRDAAAVSLKKTTLIKISIEDVEKYFNKTSDWQKKLYLTLSDRLVKSRQLITENRIVSDEIWPQGEFSPEVETHFKKILEL